MAESSFCLQIAQFAPLRDSFHYFHSQLSPSTRPASPRAASDCSFNFASESPFRLRVPEQSREREKRTTGQGNSALGRYTFNVTARLRVSSFGSKSRPEVAFPSRDSADSREGKKGDQPCGANGRFHERKKPRHSIKASSHSSFTSLQPSFPETRTVPLRFSEIHERGAEMLRRRPRSRSGFPLRGDWKPSCSRTTGRQM